MQVMQQSFLHSIRKYSHAIQVHKYYTKWETFRFTLPASNLLIQENKSRAFSCGLDPAFNTKFKGSA